MKWKWEGKLLRGLKYRDIGHGEGSVIWWWKEGQLEQRVSKAGFGDFHHALMGCDPDSLWRGRYEKERSIVSIQPQQQAFLTGELPPAELLDALAETFGPEHIVADTKRGCVERIVCAPSS